MLGPHTLTHFPTPPPFLSPHPSSCQHTSPLTSYTFPHPSPHVFPYSSQHTSLHLPPYLFLQLTSPYTPTHFRSHPMHSPHIFPHSLVYVAKLPCDDVTLINLTGQWKSVIKFFATTRNLKSCFGVRCRLAKFSMYRYESVAKLPCGKVAGNRKGQVLEIKKRYLSKAVLIHSENFK